MRHRSILFLLVLLCCVAVPALAASDQAPAFVRTAVTAPLEGREPLRVIFAPDEAACRKAYGDDWGVRCAAAPGQDGAVVSGVRLSPDIPGEWRWSGGDTMEFRPKNPWPESTAYTLSLAKLPLPSRMKLASPSLSFSTPPLAVLEMDGRLWIDPDLNGERAVSFDVRFTTQPDRQTVQRDAALKVSDKSLMLAKPEFVWGENGTCLIKSRILSLAKTPATVTLSLPGVAAEVRRDGTHWKIPKGKMEARQQVTAPGTSSLFRIKSASLETSRDASLAGEYRLTVETSLLVRPDAFAKAVTAFQLPRALEEGAVEPTPWTKAPVVDETVLNRAKPVKIEPLQPADQPAGTLRFRVPVPSDSYLFLNLPQGFGPSPAFSLAGPWREVFHAAPFQPELDFLQPGNVLALGGERKLDLHASGLTAIRWRASRVLKPYLGFLATQPQPFTNTDIPFDALSDVQEGVIALKRTDPGVPQFTVLDVAPLFKDGRGLMRIELVGMDGDKEVVSASRFLLVTDLGMIVKKNADGSRDVFVCSLSEGNPISGTAVHILGTNGLPVAEAVTDAGGRAALPSVSGLNREKRPVAVTVSVKRGADEDAAWLPLDDYSRVVDYSRFPTQGQTSNADGINAYVFSERGIFRPGETLRFGMLMRRGDWKALPPDMPFFAELSDPSERTILRRQFVVGADGLAELSWTVPEGAPTGRYRLDVQTPNADGFAVVLGSGAVRVEEFQPDTMSLSATVNPAPGKGWLNASQASADAALKNLYGLPAVDRRLRGQLSVRPASLSFPGYEDFTFHDAMPYRGSALTLDLGEVRTDAQGRAVLPLPLEKLRGGTLHCRLLVEGFEPGGGRSVTTVRDFLVSPLQAVLGYRPTGAGGNLGFIPKGSESTLEFVALGPDLGRADPGELTFSVAERRYVTSLVTDKDGRYRYDETPVDREIVSSKRSFDASGNLAWAVPTDKPGEFLLSVRNASGQIMALVPFSVAGNDDLRLAGRDELPSGNLRLHIDKADYAPGESIRLFLSSPYDGMGLITLERDSVAASRWFRVRAGNSVQEIAVPKDFEGRAYVNVSLARSLSSPDVFMQPHSYAVAPLTVNVARRDMGLRLKAPEQVLPGSALSVSLSARHPGKALIFAVDEGVLQLTAFATPDPLRYLLNDRALEVETRQMFDLLMPDHGQLRIPAFGGDMALSGGRFHNPFKRKAEPPLSWWSGIVEVGAETSVTIPVPGYYNGRVRIMAVAASPDTAGRAETDATVRGPVVLTPQLPVLASPGDEFEAALAVANNTGQPASFALALSPDEALRVVSPPPVEIAVGAGSEKVIPFRVKVGDVPGNAELRFAVTDAAGNRTVRPATLSVRPASPLRESLSVGSASASTVLKTGRELYPYEAKGSASVSALPLPALRGLIRYLDAYPYTCAEQRISRAMPYALLMNRPELLADAGRAPDAARKLARERMDEAVQGIQSALNWRGVSLWPGGEPDVLVTAYAADFLLTMRESGAALPGGLLAEVFGALENALDRVPDSLEEGRAQAYGLWVLTREGRITTQAMEQLVSQLEDRFPEWRKDVASTLLAGSCAIMRMNDDARHLIALYQAPGPDFQARGYLDALGVQALRASVLARHFPDMLDTQRTELAQELLDVLNGGRYVTLSASLGVRALLDMGGAANMPSGISLRCTSMQPGFEPVESAPADLGGMLTLSAPGCAAYALDMPAGSQPLYWEVSAQGFDRKPPSEALAQGLEVSREYLDAEGRPVTTVKQGDVVTVSISARSHGGSVSDAVIVDLLPGGFEMVLNSDIKGQNPSGEPGYKSVDRREDRMIVFSDLAVEPFVFTYKIRAVNKGVYTLPPVQAEAMYNRSLQAHSAGGVMVVE